MSCERADWEADVIYGWEADVIYGIEVRLDVCTSDAQGLLGVHRPLLDRCFEEHRTAEATAVLISRSA